MAKVTNTENGKTAEVQEGEWIQESAEKVGVPFGCEEGICGTCMIDIEEGAENLSELTEPEEDLMRDKNHRLACQCKIKKGEVKFKLS
jgi:ferredoxin